MFTIKVWMKNGEITETRRDTREGMSECVGQYWDMNGYVDGVELIRVYENNA